MIEKDIEDGVVSAEYFINFLKSRSRHGEVLNRDEYMIRGSFPPGFNFTYHDITDDPYHDCCWECNLYNASGVEIWCYSYFKPQYDANTARAQALKDSWEIYDFAAAIFHHMTINGLRFD